MVYIWNIILTSVLLFDTLPVMTQNAEEDCLPDCTGVSCRPCPNDLFLYGSPEYRNITNCTLEYTTSVSSTETTTPGVPFALNNETSTSPPVYYICVKSCPRGYYGNGSNICVPCNALCSNCSDSGITSDVCGCKYGNNNGTCLAEVGDADDQNVLIIIGAGVGGGVLLVVIIIVIACCCYRRKRRDKQGRTRMSVLLQGRDDTVDSSVHIIEEEKPPSESRKLTTLQRQNYENTGKFDDTKFAKQAQLNQDKIFRYVRDPVTGKSKKIIEEPNKRESDIYTNASAIKLNKNLRGAAAEEKEISMLPVAPKPPGFKKKKKSIFKFSLRKSGKNTQEEVGTSNRAFQEVDDQENYEDMSGKPDEQPSYTPFDPNNPEPQEDYMNYNDQNQYRDELPQEDYENFGKTALTGQKTEEDEEQEDYENVQKALSKANMDDVEEQEDYENFNVSPRERTNQMAVHDEEPSEDYANFNSDNPYMNINYSRK